MELEKIPSLIAVATFSALSLVVAHEWGYFGIIGRDFQSFFTTYDYLSELLVSIGPAFVFVMALWAVNAGLFRRDNFEARRIPRSKWGKFIDSWFPELFLGLGAIFVLVFLPETNRLSGPRGPCR
jgi:hypothetical protein